MNGTGQVARTQHSATSKPDSDHGSKHGGVGRMEGSKLVAC
jgi:hypothetical protein